MHGLVADGSAKNVRHVPVPNNLSQTPNRLSLFAKTS
jgi:hypothetical protein